ncbi:heme-degrading domain-containing protein [Herbiconiux sp. L3-i23]|uniref:heme-degrading domain-containing protein n=1 Tax=Herbiconiux sp. L3-i23 TaxID=2905871 RepID=UPI00205FE6B6|nr:heme-binding protein [Herbiconiux sp. L3-i23]BDI22513.1 UPF0303 protein [Herbiconiux sp. L3-i23]
MTDDALPVFTIESLEPQLALLRLRSFDQDDAYALGTIAAEMIRDRGLVMAVQIVIGEHVVYKAALNGVSGDTADWLRRKSNTAKRRGEPSLLVRRRLEAEGHTLADGGLDEADFAAHGGAVPIFVDDELVATITTSGEPDVIDHEVAIAAAMEFVAR